MHIGVGGGEVFLISPPFVSPAPIPRRCSGALQPQMCTDAVLFVLPCPAKTVSYVDRACELAIRMAMLRLTGRIGQVEGKTRICHRVSNIIWWSEA